MGYFSPTSSAISSSNSCRSRPASFTRHSTSSVSTDIPCKRCALLRDAARRGRSPVSECVQLNWRSFDGFLAVLSHILFNFSGISLTASSFSDDNFFRQILFDFLGRAGGSGMCLSDSPSHFQGPSIGCFRGRRQCNRIRFLSYIHWSKFCSIMSLYPVVNTITRQLLVIVLDDIKVQLQIWKWIECFSTTRYRTFKQGIYISCKLARFRRRLLSWL